MIDGLGAAHLAQLAVARLHVAGFVDGPRLQDGRRTVPYPVDVEAGQRLVLDRPFAKGEKLTGANKYTITFAKGQVPPTNGFWSFTMYMIDEGWWFVPNPLNKFTVSLRDKPKFNADGSLTLYFQNESPGKDKEANWLPAPKGEFLPMLRMYWPKEKAPSILNGTWHLPKVQKVE